MPENDEKQNVKTADENKSNEKAATKKNKSTNEIQEETSSHTTGSGPDLKEPDGDGGTRDTDGVSGGPDQSDGDLSVNRADDYVVIGCRFPNGVIVMLDGERVLLRGINDTPHQLKSKNIGFTKVNKIAWDRFAQSHADWPPLKKGYIFVSDNKDL